MTACTLVYPAVINTFSFCQLLIVVCMQTVCTCEHLRALINAMCAGFALFVLDPQIFFLSAFLPNNWYIYTFGWNPTHVLHVCTATFSLVNVRCIYTKCTHTHTHQHTLKGNITLTCRFLHILLKITYACIPICRCYPLYKWVYPRDPDSA